MLSNTLITILGMALVTYMLRAGGLWLMGFVKPSPRVEAWLKAIPGAVLVSLVAPTVLASGLAETWQHWQRYWLRHVQKRCSWQLWSVLQWCGRSEGSSKALTPLSVFDEES